MNVMHSGFQSIFIPQYGKEVIVSLFIIKPLDEINCKIIPLIFLHYQFLEV